MTPKSPVRVIYLVRPEQSQSIRKAIEAVRTKLRCDEADALEEMSKLTMEWMNK